MLNKIRQLIIGPPLPTHRLAQERLNKIRALASFSPDALSSIAYANQEIYLGLLVAGAAGLALALPIGLTIVGLLAIVALSYFQTVHAYPSGGGAYIVARSNLGTLPGLVAAAALLVGYLLTAAVSLTAGVEALASAFPVLWTHRVTAALVLLAIITLFNLRGLRETGTLMAIPVYLFLLLYLPLLAYGAVHLWTAGRAVPATPAPTPSQPLTTLLALRTFAAGCTAMTGIEAISNGVPAFRPPESKNAGRTLLVMAVLMGVLFVGSIGLTQSLSVLAKPEETILSALAQRLVGHGLAYYVIQLSTMLILAVAANTSFAGFPRLTAILGADGFLPRQLAQVGDRLVFTNGILLLAGATAVLIVVFGGNSHTLIPLFAVGVFLGFTLSQGGMVVHWWRERGAAWQLKAAVNGVGALATALAVSLIGVTKFVSGAWITVLLIPLIVTVLLQISTHYRQVAEQLSLRGLPPSLKPFPAPRIVVPISGVHRGVVDAIAYARSISHHVTAVYIELVPGSGKQMREKWQQWWPDVPLEIRPSPYRSIIGPLLDFLDETDRTFHDGQMATVLLPEFVPARWWQSLLHNQTTWLLRAALVYRRRRQGYQRAIIDVPFHLKR
jgi:amino acid transporter